MLYNYRPVIVVCSILIFTLLFEACTVVRNYPINKPFVYENNIVLTGDVSKDEKKRLVLDLVNYWDDSLKVLPVNNLGIFKKNSPLIYNEVINKPPIYDTAAMTRSLLFMGSYLNSQGYYNFYIKPDTVTIDSVKYKPQIRAKVQVSVTVNKNLSIDSVSFDSIINPVLREIAQKNQKESFLQKDKPFSNALVSNELERLVNLYHKNGYYKLTRENLYAEVDTIDAALLEVTLDPFEQAQKIAEAASRRKAKPTIDILIKQWPIADTNTLNLFYNGHVYFYPDTTRLTSNESDSLINYKFDIVNTIENITLKQNYPFVTMSPIIQHTYI